MTRRLRFALLALGAALIGAGAGWFVGQAWYGVGPVSNVPPGTAERFIDASFADLDGKQRRLSEWAGRPIVLNFWATWCPPCLQEMPGIDSRHEQYQGDLVVMAVNNDESEAQVTAYKDELSLSFEPLLDPGGKTGMLYQVRAFPTSVFVNQHGIIQFVHIGLMTESQLDDYLAQLGLGAETASN